MKKLVILMLIVLVTVFFYGKFSKDKRACEKARRWASIGSWELYIEQFPHGKCVKEAEAFFDKVDDEQACEEAKQINTLVAWEDYLVRSPKGKCAEEAHFNKEKLRKVGGVEWSDISATRGFEADDYCKNLEEGGHTDWRLPTIDELRTLIQNHPNTISNGSCKISQKEKRTTINFDFDRAECDGIKGSNFSKLGDTTKRLFSSTPAVQVTPYAAFKEGVWFVDFSTGAITYGAYPDKYYLRCVRQDDVDLCETAREEDTYKSWKNYLLLFPEGKCAEEAKNAVSDDTICESARKINTRAVWEEYLKKFPNGKCAAEGKNVRNKYRKIGNLEWSDVIGNFDWLVKSDDFSCENLEEDGYTDWREPNIDELRTLMGDNLSKLGDSGWFRASAPRQSDGSRDGHWRKGSTGWFWSNSPFNVYWVASFDDGIEIYFHKKDALKWLSFKMRCVRQGDVEACKTAKKYNDFYYWKHYLENFPKGKCVAEARAALEKEDFEACEKTKKGENTRAVWEKYLQKFPKGKCSNEANAVKNEFKKVGGLEWSDISETIYGFEKAVDYCKQLKEGGHSDWRLPTIDELRTLIQNCSKTESDGKCKMDGIKSWQQYLDECECGNRDNNAGYYSKLGDDDNVWLWSSSPLSGDGEEGRMWGIYFGGGSMGDSSIACGHYVRCVR